MMEQTPVHDMHNPDLLRLLPAGASSIIEIGCSSGALAREYKKINPECDYHGVEIDPAYVELAGRYCDSTELQNIEEVDLSFYRRNKHRDVWVFGDALEHLRDPWGVLNNIRAVLPPTGVVVACIPNAQHWSVQVRLSLGAFRYEESGLLDRTHLRWFTKSTIIEMFNDADFSVSEGIPRIFDEPDRERFLPLIGEIARVAGADSQQAILEATPLQYVIRAVPNVSGI